MALTLATAPFSPAIGLYNLLDGLDALPVYKQNIAPLDLQLGKPLGFVKGARACPGMLLGPSGISLVLAAFRALNRSVVAPYVAPPFATVAPSKLQGMCRIAAFGVLEGVVPRVGKGTKEGGVTANNRRQCFFDR